MGKPCGSGSDSILTVPGPDRLSSRSSASSSGGISSSSSDDSAGFLLVPLTTATSLTVGVSVVLKPKRIFCELKGRMVE